MHERLTLDWQSEMSLIRAATEPLRVPMSQGGVRELVLGVDDVLLKRPKRSIPRADVAELAVQSLSLPEAENRYARYHCAGR